MINHIFFFDFKFGFQALFKKIIIILEEKLIIVPHFVLQQHRMKKRQKL